MRVNSDLAVDTVVHNFGGIQVSHWWVITPWWTAPLVQTRWACNTLTEQKSRGYHTVSAVWLWVFGFRWASFFQATTKRRPRTRITTVVDVMGPNGEVARFTDVRGDNSGAWFFINTVNHLNLWISQQPS